MDVDFDINSDYQNSNVKRCLIIIFCVLLFISLVIIYARYKATSGIKVIEYKVTSSNLPDDFHGFKIVQFSDIYYGNTVDLKYLENIVSKINSLKPDIVVFTGDLLAKDFDFLSIDDIINVLKNIDSKVGKYAIRGDMDNEVFDKIIEEAGFANLSNESAEIFYKGSIPITINNLDISNENLFNILLLHEPDDVNSLANHFDLILAGHSLNGQINIPFVKKLLLPKGALKYSNGHYFTDNGDLYVSNGIGTTNFKFRFMNKPSISLYRLTNH